MARALVLLLSLLLIGGAVALAAPKGDGARPGKAQAWQAKAGKKAHHADDTDEEHGGGGCRSFAKANKCTARKMRRTASCECIGQ